MSGSPSNASFLECSTDCSLFHNFFGFLHPTGLKSWGYLCGISTIFTPSPKGFLDQGLRHQILQLCGVALSGITLIPQLCTSTDCVLFPQLFGLHPTRAKKLGRFASSTHILHPAKVFSVFSTHATHHKQCFSHDRIPSFSNG